MLEEILADSCMDSATNGKAPYYPRHPEMISKTVFLCFSSPVYSAVRMRILQVFRCGRSKSLNRLRCRQQYNDAAVEKSEPGKFSVALE